MKYTIPAAEYCIDFTLNGRKYVIPAHKNSLGAVRWPIPGRRLVKEKEAYQYIESIGGTVE